MQWSSLESFTIVVELRLDCVLNVDSGGVWLLKAWRRRRRSRSRSFATAEEGLKVVPQSPLKAPSIGYRFFVLCFLHNQGLVFFILHLSFCDF